MCLALLCDGGTICRSVYQQISYMYACGILYAVVMTDVV